MDSTQIPTQQPPQPPPEVITPQPKLNYLKTIFFFVLIWILWIRGFIKLPDGRSLVKNNFDFRPSAIIERLMLRQPIYQKTAVYGHFGKRGLPWEEVLVLKFRTDYF